MSSVSIIRGEENAPLDPLTSKTVAVIGYGNQGAAHALNLRDTGIRVVVGQRAESRGWRRARDAGLEPCSIEDATREGDLVILALPDESQPALFEEQIAPNLKPGAVLGFLHGYAIRFGAISPPAELGVVMVAPKGPGATLRARFVAGLGLPCLFAVHQDTAGGEAEAVGLAWAAGIGCARAGIIRTTFADETETDLFGEQAVLCGGVTWLILAAFETLVDAGYPPELAYLECCHELKQVTDLVYENGLASMMDAVSNTAEFGAYRIGPELIDGAARKRLKNVLKQIRDGSFARSMQEDYQRQFAWFEAQRSALSSHPIELAGRVIRQLMKRPDEGDDHRSWDAAAAE